ncbi:MAG: thiamine phosphate synthase [Myxococcales bacterium]|nr:thiamine phosphate synthase [Myxococcales bacterium]
MLPRGVYAIADGSAGRLVLDLVAAFVRGGAAVVQLRWKASSLSPQASGQLLDLARAARRICDRKALFFVNDRPDIALLAGADGVHLGQDDLPLADARRIVGPKMIIGISTHSDAEIDAAQGADYIGFGPIFVTHSKPGAPLPPPHGIDGLRRAVKRSNVPVVAIGGITSKTAADVYAAGAHCVASIADICSAPDPEAAVRSLRPVAGGRQPVAG